MTWNKENRNQYMRKYRMKHPEYDIKRGVHNRRNFLLLKIKVFNHYFGKTPACIRCRITDIRVLQLHHKNGGGAKHREKVLGSNNAAGPKFYKWLEQNNFPEIDFEPYCANCHILLRYEKHTIGSRGRKIKSGELGD